MRAASSMFDSWRSFVHRGRKAHTKRGNSNESATSTAALPAAAATVVVFEGDALPGHELHSKYELSGIVGRGEAGGC